VEAEVTVIEEEGMMRFGARRRQCCELGLQETLDVGAGTADMAALAPT
jgi:ubiquinone/menaquinone biosynthesis C-methylase UbiE